MQGARSKDKVLKKIRKALVNKSGDTYLDIDHQSSVYPPITDPLDVKFAEEFSKVNGNFIYCENQEEFKNSLQMLIAEKKWNSIFCKEKDIQTSLNTLDIPFFSNENDFNDLEVGITSCEFLIARLGSILVSSAQTSGRRMNVFPHSHVVIAHSNQIVEDIKNAFAALNEKYKGNLPSMISLITGPSRTADIEKTLVMGAHGPKNIFVILIDINKSE